MAHPTHLYQNKVQASEAPNSDHPAPTATARKPRPHSYIVLSRKQTEALLKSEDAEDGRLKELLWRGQA
jgi:hypothetical protein